MPSSVHLTRYPEPDPGLVRPDLEAAVDFVRRAVTLGLAVRNAAGVPVRQPLARAVVRAPAPLLAWLPAFASDLADELNVEALEHAAVDGGAPAEPAADASLRAATAGDVTVALDLALTVGLRRKGLVRQLVHPVKLLRKAAGLEVDNRIRLVVTAGAGAATRSRSTGRTSAPRPWRWRCPSGRPRPASSAVTRDSTAMRSPSLSRAPRRTRAVTRRAKGFSEPGVRQIRTLQGCPRPWTCPPTAG